MVNLKNYNFSGIDCKLNYSEYYDFYLNTDGNYVYNGLAMTSNITDSLLFSFNFSGYSEPTNQIVSETSWDDAVTSSFTANTYGLTGLDNGSIHYDPINDDSAHNGLINALTGSTLIHVSGDTQLKLNKVTGYTGNYVYPNEVIQTTGATGNYIDLCGGFYQGYYKLDGYDYEVLPNRYKKGWSLDTWLRKSDSICTTTGTTLNDLYPNNKGFFYYIGTRAENKFWNIFAGNTTSGCTSGSTGFCTDIKEIDVNVNNITVDGEETTIGVPLSPPPIDVAEIKNQFLIFGRSNGLQCDNKYSVDGYGRVRADHRFNKDDVYYSTIIQHETTNYTNPFLIFGRSNGLQCDNSKSDDGYGRVRADIRYTGMTAPIEELDKDKDLLDNAIGFRIKDDGSIGYRLLTISADCKSVEVVEEYSDSGLVTPDKWEHIVIKWVNNDYYDGCYLEVGKPRKGKLKFYLNSNLIFSSKELDEFIGKRLDDILEKQIGVPYNISIGGGTQGLLESMTFDGQDPDDLGLIIERNFAGTFIGSISTFNLYDTNLSWCQIKSIYNNNLDVYST